MRCKNTTFSNNNNNNIMYKPLPCMHFMVLNLFGFIFVRQNAAPWRNESANNNNSITSVIYICSKIWNECMCLLPKYIFRHLASNLNWHNMAHNGVMTDIRYNVYAMHDNNNNIVIQYNICWDTGMASEYVSVSAQKSVYESKRMELVCVFSLPRRKYNFLKKLFVQSQVLHTAHILASHRRS